MEMVHCQCGCGILIPKYDKRTRERRFVYGHYKGKLPETPWNKGKTGVQQHSEETRKKMSASRTGEKHPNWKGGQYVSAKGYIYKYKPDHHFATSDGYVFEHRLVWEQHNNAILLPWGDIHHINGNHKDNRIKNLDAMIHGKHTTLTNKGVRHGPRTDVSNRRCYQCDNITYFDERKGYYMWFKTSDGKNYICRKCWRKLKSE